MTKFKKQTEPSTLEAHLGFWLRFVSNHVSIRFQQLLEEKGVTVTEWVAMRTLLSHDETTHAELIDALGMTKGTRVSQNNVAKEANCDSSALRKSRFPLLVIAIQEWVEAHKSEQPSERQSLLKQRQKKRDTRETMADFKKQRDQAIGLLVDADLRILELSEKVADLQARLDEIKPSAKVLNL